jgi:DNA-binding NarL/FixJ family response regulator
MGYRNSLPALTFRPYRVLLVEDHQAMREAVAELLETDDRLRVWAATESAEDALGLLDRDLPERAAAGDPDIAVVDLDLPGMNGLELTGELHDRYPDLPVVILSSHTAEQCEEEALAAGALTYLPKERAAAELVDLVHTVLDQPSAQRRSARGGLLAAHHDREAPKLRPRLVEEPRTHAS